MQIHKLLRFLAVSNFWRTTTNKEAIAMDQQEMINILIGKDEDDSIAYYKYSKKEYYNLRKFILWLEKVLQILKIRQRE